MSEKALIEATLFAIEGVLAVKVLDGVVKVWSTKPELLPETIMGRKVEAYYTPPIRPMSFYLEQRITEATDESRTAKWRPMPFGVSLGEYRITAGTAGSRVFDLMGKKLILSNYHVLTPYGELDTPILQPAPYDGGISDDIIALSKNYIPIKFNSMTARNIADAAVAMPLKQDDILDEILEVGVVDGVVAVDEGDEVVKSGRTCGVKKGKVLATGAVVKVEGYKQGYAVFVDQIITEPILMPGDSGSLGVKDGKAFGLGFAGSTEVSVFSPIRYVLRGLAVSFGEPEVTSGSKAALYAALIAPFGVVGGVGYVGMKKEGRRWL